MNQDRDEAQESTTTYTTSGKEDWIENFKVDEDYQRRCMNSTKSIEKNKKVKMFYH